MPLNKEPFIFNSNLFKTTLSEEDKDVVFAYLKNCLPEESIEEQNLPPRWSKIRRQVEAAVQTSKGERTLIIEQDFFIQNNPEPHRCHLYFTDHKKRLGGKFGRVLHIELIAELDFEQHSIHIKAEGNGRAVAYIKTPVKNLCADKLDATNEALEKESRFMAQYTVDIDNPNRELFALFLTDKKPSQKKYRILMPNLGQTLNSFYKQRFLHRLSPATRLFMHKNILELAEQLCLSAEKFRSDGIIHRDLKPDNILIQNNEKAHIIDYGFACTTKDESLSYGTPLYLPAENRSSKSKPRLFHPNADSYALSLILYQWLFSHFSAVTTENFEHIKQIVPNFDSFAKLKKEGYRLHQNKLSPDLDLLQPLLDLIYRGFSLEPSERPTPAEFAACLREVLIKSCTSITYTLGMDTFSSELSDEFKEALVELIKIHRPSKEKYAPPLVKLRSQEPYGHFKTDKAIFVLKESIYLENFPDKPDLCRLYFVNHKRHNNQETLRTIPIELIVDLDLKEKTMELPPVFHNNEPLLHLTFIDKRLNNNELLIEHYDGMRRFNPTNESKNEWPYRLARAANSDKLRMFVHDKGVCFKAFFMKKGWGQLTLEERLMLGNEKMAIAEQLCRAVADVHEKGLVLRNLLPKNILIKEENPNQYQIYLGNFSLAAPQGMDKVNFKQLGYSPIESVSFARETIKLDPSLDIFALCVILSQILFLENFNTFTENALEHLSMLSPGVRTQLYKSEVLKRHEFISPLKLPAEYRSFVRQLNHGLSVHARARPSALELADSLKQLTETLRTRCSTNPGAPDLDNH